MYAVALLASSTKLLCFRFAAIDAVAVAGAAARGYCRCGIRCRRGLIMVAIAALVVVDVTTQLAAL